MRFYEKDVTAAEIRAMSSFEGFGVVRRIATLERGRAVPLGLFDEDVFGPLDGSVRRWGRLEVGRVVHEGIALEWVPVPPIADRMPIAMDDPAARVPFVGETNEAWLALVDHAERLLRLIRGHANRVLIEEDEGRVQCAFDAVVAHMRGERPSPWTSFGRTAHALVRPLPARGSSRIRALLFTDEQHLLVQSDRACTIVDRHSRGRVVRSFEPCGLRATSVHGSRIVFSGEQHFLYERYEGKAWGEHGSGMPWAIWDGDRSEWLDRIDARAPRYLLDASDVAGADVVDLEADRTMALVPLELGPTPAAWSRDGRFVLVWTRPDPEIPRVELPALAPRVIELATPRPFVDLAPVAAPATRGESCASAIAWHPSAGWRILDAGFLGDGDSWWAKVPGGAAAFSPDASELAVATDDEIVFLDASTARERARIRIRVV